MTILKFELNMLKKSVLLWSLGIVSFLGMYMSFYPSFGKDAELMELILENYPEEMLKALGMNTGLPLSSLIGYFAFTFLFIQVMIAIQASYYGFSVLSVEERDLTADFLMTKPVSRTTIFTSKFLASFIGLTITNLFIWMACFILMMIFDETGDFNYGYMTLFLTSISFFQLVYLSFGMLVSLLLKKVRSVISFAMGLGFGTFMITAISAMLDSDLLAYLSPYSHFDPNFILDKGTYDWPLALISFAIIIGSLVGAYTLYLKRNIHAL